MTILVIFGSAIHGEHPQDIDVAYATTGGIPSSAFTLQQDDLAKVREWAAERGLAPNLPIDEHALAWRTCERYRMRLPAPCGVPCDYEVLIGHEHLEVEHVPYWNIPAILRVHGHDLDAAVTAWGELRKHTLFGRMIDIGDQEPAHGDWTNYVTGLQALRSAIAKVPDWSTFLKAHRALPEVRLLNALAKRGPSQEGIAWASAGSSGCQARLLFDDDGVRTQYGEKKMPYEIAERFLVLDEGVYAAQVTDR